MTEKNYNPEQKVAKTAKMQEKVTKQIKKAVEKKQEIPKEKQLEETRPNGNNEIKKEEQTKKPAEKISEKKGKKIQKPKKTEAVVRGVNMPLSTKYSAAVCKFIKGKRIDEAIKDLEQVVAFKRPVPVKGEIPHRKGKIMSGRYITKTSKNFIALLKSLLANSNANGLENPVITEAVSNIGERPLGRFGSVQRKRTHIAIKAMEMKNER